MKDIVRLKSYPNGIRIVIAEDALFGDVLAEVSEKFKDSERFFGKAKLAVTFEGRKNTQEEEDAILDTIRQESSVNIVWRVLRKWHRAILHNFTVAACLERKFWRQSRA